MATGVVVPEDYWYEHFEVIERVFATYADYFGCTACRFHLQLDTFMDAPDSVNEAALERYRMLLDAAERHGLHLDVTGSNQYLPGRSPAWYDGLGESERWETMAHYWTALARASAGSNALLCFNVKNEPQVWTLADPEADGYYAGAFGGYQFIERINLSAVDPDDGHPRAGAEIAVAWMRGLSDAIRAVDREILVTWGGTAPGVLTAGYGLDPATLADHVDFFTYHVYPRGAGRGTATLATEVGNVRSLASHGKPLLIEETFMLGDSVEEHESFLRQIKPHVAGVLHTGAGDITNERLLADNPTAPERDVTVPYQRLHLRLRDIMMRGR